VIVKLSEGMSGVGAFSVAVSSLAVISSATGVTSPSPCSKPRLKSSLNGRSVLAAFAFVFGLRIKD
jgi:hypothetical protein